MAEFKRSPDQYVQCKARQTPTTKQHREKQLKTSGRASWLGEQGKKLYNKHQPRAEKRNDWQPALLLLRRTSRQVQLSKKVNNKIKKRSAKWTGRFHKKFLHFVLQEKSSASPKSSLLKLEGTCLMAPAGKWVKKRGKSHFGSKSQTLHSRTEKSNSDLPHHLITYLYFIRPGEEKGGELFTELSSFKSASFGYWQTEVLATTGFLSCPQKN